MITKERLEELIEKGADIWKIEDGKVYLLRKDHYQYWNIKEDRLQWYCKIVPSGYCCISFNHLFETKEDAEWYVKYGKVTKTETISFPTYEKIMQDLEGKTGTYTIINASNVLLVVNLGKHYVDQIYLYTNEDKFNWNLSKEGYEQACEMCVHEFKK